MRNNVSWGSFYTQPTENIILDVAVDVDSLSSLGGDSDSDIGSDVDLLCSLSSCSGGCFVGTLCGLIFVSGAHAKDLIYIKAPEAFQRLQKPDPFPPKDLIIT